MSIVALMVPEKLPYNATQGEKRVFSILQNLPENCVVYYEPLVSNRYPDFVAILPSTGVLVVEVKGWRHGDIQQCDPQKINVLGEVHTPPARQARDYKYRLMDRCREAPACRPLLYDAGSFKGKFRFPFAHMVVLSNIDSEQIQRASCGDLSPFFPSETTLFRDELIDLADNERTGEETLRCLERFFDPKWEIEGGGLTPSQVDALRATIHPEVIIEKFETVRTSNIELKVLDLDQEREARNIASGHRLIWGVAGSGKTVLAISRAKLLAQENPNARILMTCYNKTLAAYLKKTLENYPSIEVMHFHSLAKRIWNCGFSSKESNEVFGERLLKCLSKGAVVNTKYDAILVDEAQDFDPAWFRCLLSLLCDPDDGDLLIVGDGMQSLYKSRKITWKSLGVQAGGRTKYLRRNYRNSREIASLAAAFSVFGNTASASSDSEEAEVRGVHLSEADVVRGNGIKPLLIREQSVRDTIPAICVLVHGLLEGNFNGVSLQSPLKPEEIAVLYPYKGILTGHLYHLIENLKKETDVFWLTRDSETKNETSLPGLKVSTIHSAKGLQFRAVILFGADYLPYSEEAEDTETGERLFYVALTRAEDLLAVAAGGRSSKFVDRLIALKKQGLMDELETLCGR